MYISNNTRIWISRNILIKNSYSSLYSYLMSICKIINIGRYTRNCYMIISLKCMWCWNISWYLIFIIPDKNNILFSLYCSININNCFTYNSINGNIYSTTSSISIIKNSNLSNCISNTWINNIKWVYRTPSDWFYNCSLIN